MKFSCVLFIPAQIQQLRLDGNSQVCWKIQFKVDTGANVMVILQMHTDR